MKLALISLGALLVGMGVLVAFEVSTDIAGDRSPGFPEDMATALLTGEEIRLDLLAAEMQTVCLVPEYTNASVFLGERGLSNPPDLFVGELNALVILEAANEDIEYLGLPARQTLSMKDLGAGCASTEGVVWQPIRTMELGDSTIPVYAQKGGARLQ